MSPQPVCVLCTEDHLDNTQIGQVALKAPGSEKAADWHGLPMMQGRGVAGLRACWPLASCRDGGWRGFLPGAGDSFLWLLGLVFLPLKDSPLAILALGPLTSSPVNKPEVQAHRWAWGDVHSQKSLLKGFVNV